MGKFWTVLAGILGFSPQVLGSGFEVITTGKKKLVRSVPTELNKDHNQILELAQVIIIWHTYFNKRKQLLHVLHYILAVLPEVTQGFLLLSAQGQGFVIVDVTAYFPSRIIFCCLLARVIWLILAFLLEEILHVWCLRLANIAIYSNLVNLSCSRNNFLMERLDLSKDQLDIEYQTYEVD